MIDTRQSPEGASARELPRPSLDVPLLTAEDAASLLAVRRSWVYEAVRDGRLPCLRIGRHIRFTRELLEEWLRHQGPGSAEGTRTACRHDCPG